MTKPTDLEIASLLIEVVGPVLVDMVKPGELELVTLEWVDHGAATDGLWLKMIVSGEKVSLPMWTEGEPHLSYEERRQRLASNVQDFIAESQFGWGELRRYRGT